MGTHVGEGAAVGSPGSGSAPPFFLRHAGREVWMSSWTVCKGGAQDTVLSRCERLVLCDVESNLSPAFSLEGFGSQVRPHHGHVKNSGRPLGGRGRGKIDVVRDLQNWHTPHLASRVTVLPLGLSW